MVTRNMILVLKSEFLDFVFAKHSVKHECQNNVNWDFTVKLYAKASTGKYRFDLRPNS